jgi:hypothetical protein
VAAEGKAKKTGANIKFSLRKTDSYNEWGLSRAALG